MPFGHDGLRTINPNVTIQPLYNIAVYGGVAPTPSQGALPLDPTKEPFGNILAFARGEFAFGKYREVLWNLQKS
jgi:hypothetical protein